MRYLLGILARVSSALILGVLLTVSVASNARAIGFVVNSTADTPDANTGDLVCADSGGACTLRAAIQQTNALPGPDTITFGIGGGGVQTISPTSPLDPITDLLTIDGTSQPGFAGTPLIEIEGSSAGSGADGLTLNAGNVTVRGLAINRFDHDGILANNTGSAATIEGNFIGLAPDGITAGGNLSAGVVTYVSGTIGGTTAAQRNVISGNGAGIWLSLGAADVRGNYIGTNASGTAAVPNALGVYGQAAGNTIDANVISGNSGVGIRLFGATNNTISNNLIGTAANGTSPLGNGSHGIEFSIVTQNNQVSSGNTIAYNGGAGICACSGSGGGETFAGNSIFSNAGLGIDLNGDGVTANDAGDGDGGPNHLQNYPVLTSATSSGGTTMITGTLNSTPNTHFTIEYLSSPVCDPSTYGEGQTYFAVTLVVTTDGSGNVSVDKSVSMSLPTGYVVTSIASNASTGDSSEFSKCVQVNCPGTPGPWAVPPGDSDCDGFPDTMAAMGRAPESFILTDAMRKCAGTSMANDEPTPDAWPMDSNDDQLAGLSDVTKYSSVFGSHSPGPPYDRRFDLNGDGQISLPDVTQFSAFFGKRCA